MIFCFLKIVSLKQNEKRKAKLILKMSVSFDIKKFSNEEGKKLNDMLTFMPLEPTMKKFNPAMRYQSAGGASVRMIYSSDGKVHLPYRFACSYYQKIFNQERKYGMISEKRGNFSGKLLDRQKEPFKKAVEYLKQYRTVTIALYPGFGKTFMGVMLSWYINQYTCVLVHRENIGKQWVKTFLRYLNVTKEEVWFVDNKVKKEAKILVCMDGRIDKIPNWLKEKIGTLIIDEAHCFCAPGKVKALLSLCPNYIIAETATPTKDNGLHKVIQSICGTHYIREISNKPYNFFLIQTNLDFSTTGGNPFGQLLNAQCENQERNRIIIELLKANQDKKTIIATARTQHCEDLKSLITAEDLASSELYGTIKNYQTKNILIGTGSKMGVGFDEANFCDDYDGRPSDLLIICYTFASWAPFEQVRGRGMRTDTPNIVMFNDRHGITRKHFTQIRKWVRETNGKIHELNINKMEDFDLKKINLDIKNASQKSSS